MGNMQTMINWFEQRLGKVKYSMASRLGPNSFDCSSSVYFSLVASSYLPKGTMGNTDTLFKHLPANGWVVTNTPRRGDIFLWGRQHSAGGNYGHTGVFVDGTRVIHCNGSANGISINSYAGMLSSAGNPQARIYRNPSTDPAPEPTPQEDVNYGELELLSIRNGEIIASGWRFRTGQQNKYIAFMNAENDVELGRVNITPIKRPDIKEKYSNIEGIENSGFEVCFRVENGTAVYTKAVCSNGTETAELIFNGIIIFEQAFDAAVESYAETNKEFYFEIWDRNKLKYRDNKILNELNWSNELMDIPITELSLPITVKEFIKGRDEIKIYISNKVFHGIIMGIEEDKEAETITLDIQHIIAEWNYRQVPTNLACKNRTVNDIYSTLDFRYPNWNIEYLQNSASRVIDYVYSRQGKLDGLTKTCELTADLFWRVGFGAGRTLDIGLFGEKKPYILSTRPNGKSNIQLLGAPIIRHEFEHVINMATVYGEKSDSGMSSMSLREIYLEDGAQDSNFPVVILRNAINNERGYDYVEFTKLAPNNDIEYTVIDTESIALEGGTAIEGTFAFNDLAPFNTDSQEITDEDRAKASKIAYDATVKRLKQSRRRYIIDVSTTRLPGDINIGDMVRFIYDNELLILDECSNYQKKILNIDDWFYITKIEYIFDQSGTETNIISLEKFLQIDRESDWQ